MKESRKEAQRWWKQAQNDLGYAELGLREGYYAQACFQSHQVAEKALKALHYGLHEKRFVTGHSLARLSEGEGIDEEMHERLLVLDQYYITARYPNGLPDAAPFEVYTKRQAESAVETARAVLRWTQEVLEQL